MVQFIKLELADALDVKKRLDSDISEKYMYVNMNDIKCFWERSVMTKPGRYTENFDVIIEPEYKSQYLVELTTRTLEISEASYQKLVNIRNEQEIICD